MFRSYFKGGKNMADATLGTITKEIEKQESREKALEETRAKVDAELPIVKANLEALRRSLAILKGEDVETIPRRRMFQRMPEKEITEPILPSTHDKGHSLRKGSSSYLAYLALENRSLTLSELFEIVKREIPELNRRSFDSGIYRFIRIKKFFKKDDFGKISILA